MKMKAPVQGFVPVSILLDPEITLADLKVYTALSSFQGSNDDSYPSREAILDRCGLVVETISRSVKHLIELGWIQRDQRGLGRTNIYRVMIEVELPVVTPKSLQENASEVTPVVTPKSLPSNKKNSEKNTGKEYPQDSPPLILATLLLTEHRKMDEKFLVGKEHITTQRWAADIDKLIRLDKRTPDEIRNVILWCQSPGCFWAPNILSGSKLRDKFATILGQSKMKSAATTKKQFGFETFDPERSVPDEILM